MCMNSTYQQLENASNEEVKELHGQIVQELRRLQKDRRLVLEELDERHDIDDPDESVDADIL